YIFRICLFFSISTACFLLFYYPSIVPEAWFLSFSFAILVVLISSAIRACIFSNASFNLLWNKYKIVSVFFLCIYGIAISLLFIYIYLKLTFDCNLVTPKEFRALCEPSKILVPLLISAEIWLINSIFVEIAVWLTYAKMRK
ncbi:hypothetical protein, partial [Microbulbifer sp. 2205BS26-8]|uniref:hypothetical protein n=1 Tax=Microbulbifer sp. 2205BS26-8 TaxID=3064386 RepID=UPI00273DFCA4